MSLARVITAFMVMWIVLYLFAYFFFIASSPTSPNSNSNGGDNNSRDNRGLKLANTPFEMDKTRQMTNKENSTPSISSSSSALFDPFVSVTCDARIKGSLYGARQDKSVVVVIPTRNEPIESLIRTIQSILANSGTLLRRIIVIDDMSTKPISLFSEMEALIAQHHSQIVIQRPPHRMGVAGAKAMGATAAIAEGADVLVFVDAHVVVSTDWLYPLVGLLNKHPHSIVYPALDVLDGVTGDIIKSHNVVGAFDWSLNFKWESVGSISDSARVPLASVASTADDELSSPAAPGIFAMKAYYYEEIGGIDTSLQLWGHESVELSIRAWLCGGAVIRQPCSRVAHQYSNLLNDSPVSNGIPQSVVDENVMTVAEHWLSPEQREVVYRARFLDRVPYRVLVSIDARLPQQFHKVQMLRDEACQNFDWFLKEIYPGLLADVPSVEEAFKTHLKGDEYLDAALSLHLGQYIKESSPIRGDANEIEKLKLHAHTDAESIISLKHKSLEPKPVRGHTSKLKSKDEQSKKAKPAFVIEKSVETDEHEKHANKVRESLLCEDETNVRNSIGCLARSLPPISDCVNDKNYMMFGCPKTCGFCGDDGLLCIDFYEKKCLEWKAQGKCESDSVQMHHVCRVSCGMCTNSSNAKKKSESKISPPAAAAAAVIEEVAPVVVAAAPAAVVAAGGVDPIIEKPLPPGVADPYVAQKQFSSGMLLEPSPTSEQACYLNDKPHGQLLARVNIFRTLATAASPQPKVFCGIYTMEKNHETNVKATKETWAKKCDGFVAFSTVEDKTIPSINIEHEGEEAYDNMWQKSRSIWKYIAANYASHFDYFLLGGDDMFYIIENYKHFLSSAPIADLNAQGKGLFLGRRFFPPGQEVFNSGGAGYTLNRRALEVLAGNIDTPKCYPHQKGFWEDVNVANCLRVSSDGEIVPYDTRDAQERERFHPFTPGQHLTYRIPPVNPDWYPKYNPYLKEGYDCCSDESVSFHYCPAETMRSLYAYTYHCGSKHL